MWPLVLTWATDINTDPLCFQAMDPDTAPSSSTGWDITMTSGTGQAAHITLFLTIITYGSSLYPSSWAALGVTAIHIGVGFLKGRRHRLYGT